MWLVSNCGNSIPARGDYCGMGEIVSPLEMSVSLL